MADDEKKSQAVTVMMSALNWAYDQAASDIPGLGSAEGLANSYLKSAGGSVDKAIDDLINWQTGYAGAAGFATNLVGIMTMPIAIPANLASVLLIQFRMIAAIAHLRGYQISDERVRTLAFLSLTGSSAATVLQEFSVKLGTKLTASMISKVSAATLTKINQAVGFRLVTKAGQTGLVNLSKFVPLIGGIIGGGFDAVVTRGIGAVAKENFPLITTEAPPAAEPEDAPFIDMPPSEPDPAPEIPPDPAPEPEPEATSVAHEAAPPAIHPDESTPEE
jgi:hypothetical protein